MSNAGPILHLDTALEWRGGQVQLLLLVRGMVARGRAVAVACPPGSPLWAALEGLCPRVAVPPGVDPRTPFRLGALRPALVAAHTSHAHGLAAVARAFGEVPLVVHRRVDFVPARGAWPGAGWKYRRPDAYVAVSEAVARLLRAAGGRAVHVVHDGVAPLAPLPPAPDGPTVLAVGARVPHKGHAVLAEAARHLPGVDIGVAGEGPLTPPGLRWLGPRADIAALHAAARVFVHPSVEEGMGQAVVEAMLAGLPVVASDAGGLPEVLGDTGILVPRGDAVALAAGIRRALDGDHPPLAAARARAQARFSVDAMVGGTLAVYDALLGAPDPLARAPGPG